MPSTQPVTLQLKEYECLQHQKIFIHMYMCNYCSHTFKDFHQVNPVIKKDVGTPPLLLPMIVHPRRGDRDRWMRSAEYFNMTIDLPSLVSPKAL